MANGASYMQGLWLALLLSIASGFFLALPEPWLAWIQAPPAVEGLMTRYLRPRRSRAVEARSAGSSCRRDRGHRQPMGGSRRSKSSRAEPSGRGKRLRSLNLSLMATKARSICTSVSRGVKGLSPGSSVGAQSVLVTK